MLVASILQNPVIKLKRIVVLSLLVYIFFLHVHTQMAEVCLHSCLVSLIQDVGLSKTHDNKIPNWKKKNYLRNDRGNYIYRFVG